LRGVEENERIFHSRKKPVGGGGGKGGLGKKEQKGDSLKSISFSRELGGDSPLVRKGRKRKKGVKPLSSTKKGGKKKRGPDLLKCSAGAKGRVVTTEAN